MNNACIIFFLSVFLAFPVQSQTIKRKTGFNLHWRFYKGDPAGNPFEIAYNDNSWEMVSVPHSASYDKPDSAGEASHYEGIAWYRKTFTVPSGARKVFLQFEGAMQTAEVWVNGVSIGRHDNSGYTGFVFDISDNVLRGVDNVCAIKLDNTRSIDIPPGSMNPDYYLFSGLYRDVWLLYADSVYIPFCGQQVSSFDASASSAKLCVKTTINNDAATARSCEVIVTLFDSAKAFVASQSATQSVPAAGNAVFDMNIGAISSPHLWSPERPYLYSAMTLVKVMGQVVDSSTTRVGIRWFSWDPLQGFSLNGSRYELKGVCLHQTFGWIENALPNSRHVREVAYVKDIGANGIRCSHYPRDPAFYDACDSLGMVLLVEVPTWGFASLTWSDGFWTRLDNCAREMALQAYNHPSIIAWGVFNEAQADYSSHFSQMVAAVHAIDTTRPVYAANNALLAHTDITDIVGLNYQTSYGNQNKAIVNTEYNPAWESPCRRGDSCDTHLSSASAIWNYWKNVEQAGPRLAGGFLWVFNDYRAWWWKNTPMGMVDHVRVPKTVYYYFRQQWTQAAPDYPQNGTATNIELIADLSTLQADGTDISRLIATLRDESGACINSTRDITFSVSGPATIFGDATIPTAAGKAGAVLRTTTLPGTIIVIAASPGLSPDTVRLQSTAAIEDDPNNQIRSPELHLCGGAFHLRTVSTTKGYLIFCPPQRDGRLRIINSRGEKILSCQVKKGSAVFIDRRNSGPGIYYAVWDDGATKAISCLPIVN